MGIEEHCTVGWLQPEKLNGLNFAKGRVTLPSVPRPTPGLLAAVHASCSVNSAASGPGSSGDQGSIHLLSLRSPLRCLKQLRLKIDLSWGCARPGGIHLGLRPVPNLSARISSRVPISRGTAWPTPAGGQSRMVTPCHGEGRARFYENRTMESEGKKAS